MTTKTAFSPAALIRWTGLAGVGAGLIFAGIQPIHPPDLLASVTTGSWAIIIALKFAMCLLFLVAITGIYARQAGRAGWLGFAGFALLVLSWWLQTGFVFVDAFVLPVLATATPGFIDSFLGIVNPASPAGIDIGALPVAYGVIGISYMLGGLLFGIATVRARVLPTAPSILLAVAATLTPLAALLPHEIQRFAAIPVALAIAWLGYALFTERHAASSQPALAAAA
jgi:hypothetical protein